MARGNRIVISTQNDGKPMEGYVAAGETHYPGMVVQRDASIALKGGRHTYKLYAPGTDGEQPLGAFWVVIENYLIGGLTSTPYAAGDRLFLYCPEAGDELNLLLKNLAGTGDDHALNEKLMVDTGTGMLIPTTGSPETEVAQLLEAVTDPTVDTLAWCQWSGH